MVKIFSSNDDYIEFLVNIPILKKEVFCLSFIPIAFFSKDQIKIFFERKEPTKNPDSTVEALWSYGNNTFKQMQYNNIVVCLEESSIKNMCSKGIIHKETQNYEIGFADRVYVLKKMLKVYKNIFLTSETMPFIFRMHYPDEVIIDIKNNTHKQQIQGIWIKDINVFSQFNSEFLRLKESSNYSHESFRNEIKKAISSLSKGINYEWALL